MDNQENRNNQTNQTNQNEKGQDHPLKKAAMATIGAISSAVEKVADVIGDVATKENLDKFAKKGEDTYNVIKEKSGEVFTQVKDFSVSTYEKVKDAMEDPEVKKYTTVEEARTAMEAVLEDLRTAAAAGKVALAAAADLGEKHYHEAADRLSQQLKDYKDRFDKLHHRIRGLENEAAVKERQTVQQEEDTEEGMMGDGNIVYDSDKAPRPEGDKDEHAPADAAKASPTAPEDENNTNKLKAEEMNDHLNQGVPPEY